MPDRHSQKAVAEFISEAQETIEALGRDLLGLEGARRGDDAEPELVNSIFRAAHSLKGLAGMFGVERMSRLAHALEDLLDGIRLGRRRLDAAALDLLLETPDVLSRIIAEESSGAPPSSAEAADALAQRLRAAGADVPPPSDDPIAKLDLGRARALLTEYEEHRLRANVAKGVAIYRIGVTFDLATFDTALTDLNDRLRPLGEVVSTLPSADHGDPATIAFELLFGSQEDADRVGEAAGTAAVVREVPRRAGGIAALPPAHLPVDAVARDAAASDGAATIRSVSQAVRVDIHELDRLMNVVGELVLVKTALVRLAERLKAGEQPAAIAADMHRENRSLERKLNELQAGVLEVRMVPLGQVFDKLARMVRKISRELGKEVEFSVTGGEVELDKLIIEDLSDPLMHLLRNAVDHAIEPPDVRAREGKPPAGSIRLSAEQRGSHVVIAVEDDGTGIDEARVREVAVERRLASAKAVEEMTHREVLNLIFLPGFSTARQVTTLSGRGVGMDVVKNNVANLSGVIDLRTEWGKGTRFELTLPVTLAIVRALGVGVAGRTYAIPLSSVLEILSIDPAEIRTIETREVVTLRDATVPLVRLGRLFRLPGAEREPALAWPRANVFVVVVGLAQERLGISVDEVLGQQDIVVKPLGPVLAGVRGIAGATDLGNRRTVLVLDVGAIVDEVTTGDPIREAAV